MKKDQNERIWCFCYLFNCLHLLFIHFRSWSWVQSYDLMKVCLKKIPYFLLENDNTFFHSLNWLHWCLLESYDLNETRFLKKTFIFRGGDVWSWRWRRHSHLQQFYVGGTGQGWHELAGLTRHWCRLKLRPCKLPLLLAACSHGTAVHGGAQVRVDAEEKNKTQIRDETGSNSTVGEVDLISWSRSDERFRLLSQIHWADPRIVLGIVHPLFEPHAGQVLALCESGFTGRLDCIDLVIPVGGDTPLQ